LKKKTESLSIMFLMGAGFLKKCFEKYRKSKLIFTLLIQLLNIFRGELFLNI